MRVAGVPVGTETLQRQFAAEAMRGDPAELLRTLVPIEDAQAAFQIMRSSTVFLMTLLLRALPFSVARAAAEEYDALLEWALASVITGQGAGAAGPASLDEVRTNHSLCRQQTMLGPDELRQAHLPVQEGGLGLTSSAAVTGAAYIGCEALAHSDACSLRPRRAGYLVSSRACESGRWPRS